jgi:predicted enzyme related to lactoylglutathione lyase
MGINGGLYERPAENKIHTYDCTVSVDNIDSVTEAAVKHGGTVTSPKSEIPGVGFFVGIRDTEGNRVGLLQPTEWRPQ